MQNVVIRQDHIQITTPVQYYIQPYKCSVCSQYNYRLCMTHTHNLSQKFSSTRASTYTSSCGAIKTKACPIGQTTCHPVVTGGMGLETTPGQCTCISFDTLKGVHELQADPQTITGTPANQCSVIHNCRHHESEE